jgi:ubiquitin-conjugating enzyme (huntingtin interacting protein 2)
VTGAICLDILKDQWSPAFTLKTALLSVRALLTAAEPDDPQDGVVANQYKSNYAEFERTARFWTESYAMEAGAGAGGVVDAAVAQLTAMGFSASAAKSALLAANGNVERACNALIMG